MKECQLCKKCYTDEVVHCPNDGMLTVHTISGEPVLEGKYHLECRIGQGGMGVVYKARHAYLKTLHAIKIILPDLVGNDPQLVTRFRQEALAAAAIRHQNVVGVSDYGVIAGTVPFLVMEYVEGESLHDMLAREKKLSPETALELMAAICAGVGAAHHQGIVHRDLKPLNIMICADKPTIGESVKILDFGLAKIKSGELLGSFIQAQTTGLMGSPYYMAPEQWADDDLDSRSDIYSLGVMLFQMLAGDVPFKGSSIPAIMKKHISDPPPTFAEIGLQVSPELEAAVRHTLQKDPKQRTATVEMLVAELRNAIHPGYMSSAAVTGRSLPVSSLRILTKPAQASVYVDNVAVGQSRNDGWLMLEGIQSGNHHLRVSHNGFNDWLGDVVCDGKPQQVVAELKTGAEPTVVLNTGQIPIPPAGGMTGEKTEVLLDTNPFSTRVERSQPSETMPPSATSGFDASVAGGSATSSGFTTPGFTGNDFGQTAAEPDFNPGATAQPSDFSKTVANPAAANLSDTSAAMNTSRPIAGNASIPPSAGQKVVTAPVSDGKKKGFFSPLVFGIIGICGLFLLGIVGIGGAYALGFIGQKGGDPTPTVTPSPGKTGTPTPGVSPVVLSKADIIAIPAGEFRMGRNDGEVKEKPEHPVTVAAFQMDRTEVTNAEYYEFVKATGYAVPNHWVNGKPVEGSETSPVRFVSFEDAEAFAKWRSERDGATYRLPTEEEWEYAARNGDKGNLYPWGNDWSDAKAVMGAADSEPSPVGSKAEGKNAWGVMDLIGNVWELTSSEVSAYPGSNLEVKKSGEKRITVRGGSAHENPTKIKITSTFRADVSIKQKEKNLGFRLVRSG